MFIYIFTSEKRVLEFLSTAILVHSRDNVCGRLLRSFKNRDDFIEKG